MPRILGDLTLDEYIGIVRAQHRAQAHSDSAPPSLAGTPRRSSRRKLAMAAKAVGLASCLVFAFVAGTQNQHPARHDVAPAANSFLIDPAHWPTELEDQKNAVLAAMKHAVLLVDQLQEVHSTRIASADVVRRHALGALKNIAVRCVEGLRAKSAQGDPFAQEMLERIDLALAGIR